MSAPFALGLAAQVGVLTHLVSLVTPALGSGGAARAVSATTAAAVVGRLLTGFVVDRVNRRLVASATLVVQIAGLGLLAWAPSVPVVYAGCALFGLGVGNLTTLPGLILAVEWPRERFSALVGLVVAINQFTFAFGPSLVGVLRDWAGTYGPALGVCAALQAMAAVIDPARARGGSLEPEDPGGVAVGDVLGRVVGLAPAADNPVDRPVRLLSWRGGSAALGQEQLAKLAFLRLVPVRSGRARHVGDDADVAGHLVGGDAPLAVGDQLGLRGRFTGARDDIGHRGLVHPGVGDADHEGLEHLRVGHEEGFDLGRRHHEVADAQYRRAAVP